MAVTLFVASALACSATTGEASPPDTTPSKEVADDAGGPPSSTSSTSSASSTGGAGGGSVDAAAPPVPVIYANAQFNGLYKFDPVTNKLSLVAFFDGNNQCHTQEMFDIAIDKNLQGYLSTKDFGLFRFDLQTGRCTASLQREETALALGFVPQGAQEALVGSFFTSYFRIDAATGAATALPSPPAFVDAEDIVSTIEGRSFAVRTSTSGTSTLLEIEPTTGKVVKDFGDFGAPQVRGLAAWGATLYGFTGTGQVFSVVPKPGGLTPTLVAQLPDVAFRGAASAVPPSAAP